jgi:hypothetical protein
MTKRITANAGNLISVQCRSFPAPYNTRQDARLRADFETDFADRAVRKLLAVGAILWRFAGFFARLLDFENEHVSRGKQSRHVELGRSNALADLADRLAVERDRAGTIRRLHDHPDFFLRPKIGRQAEPPRISRSALPEMFAIPRPAQANDVRIQASKLIAQR